MTLHHTYACTRRSLLVCIFIQLAVQTSASEHGEQSSLLEMIACTAALHTAYLQQMHVKDVVTSTDGRNAVNFGLSVGSVILGSSRGMKQPCRRSLLLQGAAKECMLQM